MSTSLMTTRRFAPLFWCQFFSAFGDNFLKTALVFLILFQIGGADAGALITLAGATLIFPFFLLSGLGGELADRYDKALVAQRLKLFEIAVAALAVVGFAIHSIVLLFVAVGLYGTIASLFGPIKYGILPDHLARSELPSGNALVEGGTFLAILIGTIVAGIAAKDGGDPIHFRLADDRVVGGVLGRQPVHSADRRGRAAPCRQAQHFRLHLGAHQIYPRRAAAVVGRDGVELVLARRCAGAFAAAAARDLQHWRQRGRRHHLPDDLLGRGGVGSGLAAWLAHGRIVLLPTLVAGVLLGLFSLDLAWTTSAVVAATSPLGISAFFASPYSIHIAIDLAGLAISGGLFIVPTFSAVQAWADADQRARVVAAVNVLNAVFMVVGAIVLAVLQKLGLSTPLLFAMIGVANLVVAVIIARTLPTSWLNDLLSIVFRTFYRLEVTGLENVAKAGHNAIIAMNHVSFLDPPVAMAILPKRPVFAVDTGIAQRWWIKPFLPFVRTMALDPLKPMALRTIINAVKDGNMLVIFPEGRITITGSLMKIYDGAAMIADKSDAMVVPVRIDGPEKHDLQPLDRAPRCAADCSRRSR